MGGDCLNTGCVPSKALLRAARQVHDIRRASEFGIEVAEPIVDFAKVMERLRGVITAIEPHDSTGTLPNSGWSAGKARPRSHLHGQWKSTARRSTRSIVIAAGAAFCPPIPGLDSVNYKTSDTIWSIDTLPKSLVVLGGGPIGCELAQAFNRLGAEVTLVEMAPSLLVRDEPEFGQGMLETLRSEGINVRLSTQAKQALTTVDGDALICESGEGSVELKFDVLLVGWAENRMLRATVSKS